MRHIDDARLQAVLDPVPADWSRLDGLRKAAVIAPLVRRAEVDHLLFTLRPEHLPRHAGQVSFPGGGVQGDETPVACALREGEEEIGLRAGATEMLGALPPVTSSSSFHVHTLVARVRQEDFVPDPQEVAEILWVPVAALLAEGAFVDRAYEKGGRRFRPTPHFAFAEHTIWGLTGILAARLVDRFSQTRPPGD